MLVTSQPQSSGPVLIASSPGESQPAIKLVSSSSIAGLGTTTKTLTLAQAQQMGLVTTTSKVRNFILFSKFVVRKSVKSTFERSYVKL